LLIIRVLSIDGFFVLEGFQEDNRAVFSCRLIKRNIPSNLEQKFKPSLPGREEGGKIVIIQVIIWFVIPVRFAL